MSAPVDVDSMDSATYYAHADNAVRGRTPNLNKALAAAQAEFRTFGIDEQREVTVKHNDGGSHSYKYITLGKVIEATAPILAKHGLSFRAMPGYGDPGDGKIGMVLRYALAHESGEQIDGVFPLSDGGKGIQGLGSAITYARRYILGALLNIAVEQDDDGMAAMLNDDGTGGSVRKGRPPTATARTNRPRRSGPPDTGAAADLPGGDPAEGREEVPQGMLNHMFGLFGKIPDMTDRDTRLRAISAIVGRPITSSSQLTRDEVHAVSERAQARVDALALNPPTDGPPASDSELVDGPTDNTAPEES